MHDAAALRQALDQARARLDAAVAALADADFNRPVTPGDWSVRDLLNHVAAWDRVAAQTVREIWAEMPLTQYIAAVDEFNANVAEELRDRSPAACRAELAAARGEFLAVLDEAPATVWSRVVRPDDDYSEVSLASICTVWRIHDIEHAEELETFIRHQSAGTDGAV